MINKKIKENFPSIVIGCISTIFILFLHFFGVFDNIELKLVDYRFNLRGEILDDLNENNFKKQVVIVEIDDESFKLIPDPIPYGRGTVWSNAIRNLSDAGARVIVIDAMFDKPDHQTKNLSSYLQSKKSQFDFDISDGDSELLKAIEYANSKTEPTKVILSSKRAVEENRVPKDYLLTPTKKLIESQTQFRFGLVNVGPDSDGFIRRYPIFLPISGDTTLYYTLAVESVLAFNGYKGEKNISLDPNRSIASIGNISIKTYGNSNMFQINYSGPVSSIFNTFPRYPLSSILDTKQYDIGEKDNEGNLLEDINWMDNYIDQSSPLYFLFSQNNPFKDKIVVIGSSLSEDQDIHPTPFLNYDGGNYQMSGVEIHANAIQQILNDNYITTPMGNLEYDSNFRFNHFLLIILLVFITLLLVTKPEPIISLVIIIVLVLSWLSYSIGSFCLDYLWLLKIFLGQEILFNISQVGQSKLLPVVFPMASMLVPYGLNLSYKLYTENQDKKFLKNTFGNYISSELVDQMYESKKIPELGGKEGYHTLIFSDIASFSSFSEAMTAPELVELLNEYLTAMTRIILNNGGTVDKYIGDAIVAFYGAPVDVDDHENKAILTVVQMNQKLKELKQKWRSEGDKWPDLVKNMQHRVGVNTGYLVTGNMGSELQMNYTCMGDTVNLAARLESGSKQWGIDAQVAQSVFDKTKDGFIFRKLGGVRVKGKKDPVNVYELLCERGREPKGLDELLNQFEKARKLYLSQDWDNAIKEFQICDKLEDMSNDRHTNPSRTYIKICSEFKATPPGENWDGIYTFKQK